MNIVILGAGYAGITAALRLARRSGPDCNVTLASESPTFTERIRLHEIAAGRAPRRHRIADLLGKARVTLRIGRVEDVRELAWDRLVLALGSRIDDRLPGVREHAVTVDPAAVTAFAERLADLSRVVVVGGGLTGLEAATELAEAQPRLRVTLVTRGEPGAGFSAAARGVFREACERLRVEVLSNVTVRAVEHGRLLLDEGTLAFDACLWGSGFLAAPLPAGLDLATNAAGQVLVDPLQRAISDERVFAIGDLAAGDHPTGCKSAIPSGAHVADTIVAMHAGRAPRPFAFAAPIYCVSLGRRDGVIQRVAPDGSLTGGIVRGRLAAWVKERICRSTLFGLRLERLGLMSYSGFEPRTPKRLPQEAA